MSFDRRRVLGWMVRGFAFASGAFLFAKRRRASGEGLRPPGALAEDAFLAACIRCFRCAEVCPPRAIVFELSLDPRTADTPFIHAAESACTLCMRCTEVCPTGALALIPRELEKAQSLVKMGTPILDRERCLAWTREGVCRLCFYACPYAESAVTIKGPQLAPIFHADACVGCGLCEQACPIDVRAIRIAPREEKR